MALKTSKRRQDGFKAHLVVEPDTGLATVVALTKATGPLTADAAVGAVLVTTDPTLSGIEDDSAAPVEVLGDSAYGTGNMLETMDRRGWVPVIKPCPIKPAVEGVGSPSTTSPTTQPPQR